MSETEPPLSERSTTKWRLGRPALVDLVCTLAGAYLIATLAVENRLGSFGARFALLLPGWALISWGVSTEVTKQSKLEVSRLAIFLTLLVSGPALGLFVRLLLD